MTDKDTQEFARDLGRLQTRVEDEAHVYKDMPQEGKRKCMEDLDNAIQTLQKIKTNLKETDDCSPDKNVVQVVWRWHKDTIPTKEDFDRSFDLLNSRSSKSPKPVYVPCIKSVVIQDNFTLDTNKNIQPVKTCFVYLSTEEDFYTVLGFKEFQVSVKTQHGSSGLQVEFTLPSHSMATYKTLSTIGNSLARLEEIDKELKKIGAGRHGSNMPTQNRELVDKAYYATELKKFKAIRAAGNSIEQHAHALLFTRQPVDSEALKISIKKLYDEECDILIQLREFQLNGVDFDFKHPSIPQT